MLFGSAIPFNIACFNCAKNRYSYGVFTNIDVESRNKGGQQHLWPNLSPMQCMCMYKVWYAPLPIPISQELLWYSDNLVTISSIVLTPLVGLHLA